MIVVDTNVIVPLLLPTEHSADAERLFRADPDWVAPVLWRSEMRNVLALYLRKALITIEHAVRRQSEAEALLQGREYEVPSRDVLELVGRSQRSAYDCEFVALAQSLGLPLVTLDRQVLAAFPEIAMPLHDAVSRVPLH